MRHRRINEFASRQRDQRDLTRHDKKVLRRARAIEPDASPTIIIIDAPQVQAVPGDASGTDPNIYCTDPAGHARFHRRLQGRTPTCCICGPRPGDS